MLLQNNQIYSAEAVAGAKQRSHAFYIPRRMDRCLETKMEKGYPYRCDLKEDGKALL